MPDFPPKKRDLLLHLILSHHGELEYGSPKVPLFPEALLLHHLDNMDSKMECMRALIDRDHQIEGVWTGYSSPLERSVLKKRKFLEETPEREAGSAGTPSGPSGVDAGATVASPAPVAAPAQNKRREPSASVFGDKLLDALGRKP
jgi:3'-5' exoribonuclease